MVSGMTSACVRACVQGCFTKLSSFMETNFLMIGGVAVAFAFLQVSSVKICLQE